LKPYIRRDINSEPIKLGLHQELAQLKGIEFHRAPIDYVHLRPEHVLQINHMCRQFFWNGIDISECLHYPDFTIVALYKKLIVGFALLFPRDSLKENYLSFILVHPDWRKSKTSTTNSNISIAEYMMYYLMKVMISLKF